MSNILDSEVNTMTELPISAAFKEYYAKHNASFSDAERATIFWNSRLPLEQILTALKEIMDTTFDETLKEQIKARLDYEDSITQEFMKKDNRYVQLVLLDNKDSLDSVFLSLEAAIEYGKESCENTFRIIKELPDDLQPIPDDAFFSITTEFNKDGTLLARHFSSSEDIEVQIAHSTEPNSFEHAYIPLLNPFEYGDLVRIMGTNIPAIVSTSKERWYEHKNQPKEVPMDYHCNSLTVEFLHPDATISHGHPDILSLEKLDHWDNQAEWKFLTSVRDIMQGCGCVEMLIGNYEVVKGHI